MKIIARPIDGVRLAASNQLDQNRRADLGQFMTSSAIADFMASLFQKWPEKVNLLDPGAGVGSLSEAFVKSFVKRAPESSKLDITAYEIEPLLTNYLKSNLAILERTDKRVTSRTVEQDFIKETFLKVSFGEVQYTHAILNPPYKKIPASSAHRKILHDLGVEAPNLYIAFLALTIALVKEEGEVVAIIPRSFCNGLYFRQFRLWLLEHAAITHLHIFESRKKAFRDDNVLQENIIIRLVCGVEQGSVVISQSHDAIFLDYTERIVPFVDVVKSADREKYIHIPIAETNQDNSLFSHSLKDLGLEVATGPVVDFRVKSYWSASLIDGVAPLVYSHHFAKGGFRWPREHKKPNAILVTAETKKLLMPQGWYVVIKRFSSKEERRRIVAHVVNPRQLPYDAYGFENHLNVIHAKRRGISAELAHGLAVFLNSTIIDSYFRSFSGHTQVNATDLRNMKFPGKQYLVHLGNWARKQHEITQQKIDSYISSQG